MALTMGESHASTHKAIQYLSETKSKIDKSTLRLASGNKIISAADDPAGLAVALKLQNELSVTNAKASSVNNAQSYAEMQSTALASAMDLIDSMISLKAEETSGNLTTAEAYEQFGELRTQLLSIAAETLNGTKLFNRVVPVTDTDGFADPYVIEGVSLDDLDLDSAISAISAITSEAVFAATTDNQFSTAYDVTSGLKTAADADASTLGFAADYLSNMAVNIESAHGRIMDVDVAEETINLSKLNMQQEAALAAIVQANVAMTAVLDLLIKPKD
jgi:flagellin